MMWMTWIVACGLAGSPQPSDGFEPRLWGAIESYSYHGKMRRRLALGLADPLIVERGRGLRAVFGD